MTDEPLGSHVLELELADVVDHYVILGTMNGPVIIAATS